MMRVLLVGLMVVVAAARPAAGPVGSVTGEYVEARTAEVFTGGCIMSSEAETIGRQAVLAWRVTAGQFAGESLDGLAVVAAVSGDRNLGIREIGGTAPSWVKAVVIVDDRATSAQRDALVGMVRALSEDLITDVVEVAAAPIRFESTGAAVRVTTTGTELAVQKRMEHMPGCGARQWFTPLSQGTSASLGFTDAHRFSGAALGTRWSHPQKKSSFVGSFTY